MNDSGTSSDAVDDLDALFLRLETEVAEPISAASVNRRGSPRVEPKDVGRDIQLTVRGAATATLVNLSETGALAETTSRLLPGSVVELLLQIDGVRHLMRATIMRSVVHSLSPRPLFRTSFKFEEPAKFPERR
jgi:hypothetical protein